MRATVALVFAEPQSGREVGHVCRAPTPRNRHGHRCQRLVTAGVLKLTGKAGKNHVRFDGRLSRKLKLPAGSYLVYAAAADQAGHTTVAKPLAFTIVP